MEMNNGPLNIADIKGSQTGATLTISPARDADAGNYTVEVSTSGGGASSLTPSQLLVVDPPMFVGLPSAGKFHTEVLRPGGTELSDLELRQCQPASDWLERGVQRPIRDWSQYFTDTHATNRVEYYCITAP